MAGYPSSILLLSLSLHINYAAAFANPPYCNSSFANYVNGSGSISFDPGIRTAQSPNGSFADYRAYNLPDAEWLVTVQNHPHQSRPYSAAQFFLHIGDQEYYNDTQTLFDACAFFPFSWITKNTAYLSQNDPGDCSATLRSDCITALKERLVEAAEHVILNPPAEGLHAGILPRLCYDIGNYLSPIRGTTNAQGQKFPRECLNEWGLGQHEGLSMLALAMTGPNRFGYKGGEVDPHVQDEPWVIGVSSGVRWDCPTHDDSGKTYYWTNLDEVQPRQPNPYDLAMHQAWPIFEVYFQVANDDIIPAGTGVQFTPSARLSCPRVRNVSKGSEEPPALPQGTPTSGHIPGTLSKAELGGIIAGSIIGGLLLIGLTAFAVVRWRRARRRDKANELESRYGKATVLHDEHELNDLSTPGSERNE